MSAQQPKHPTEIRFDCTGRAVGKMRNEFDVRMVSPWEERFEMASDEGAFHGGEGSAPPPLALFVAGMTGCLMTQMRAFAKRLGVRIDDLRTETRAIWKWTPEGRLYETAPKGFEIDILLDSPDPLARQKELIAAAKRGCFIEQTLGRANVVRHRLKTAEGWIDADAV